MEKNQKILICVLIAAFAIVLGISCFVGDSNNNTKKSPDTTLSDDADTIMANAEKESQSIADSEKKELKEISVSDYLNYYKGEEHKIVLLARPTCGYCQIAEPIIQYVAYKNDLEINYVNTDGFSGDDEKNLIESDEYFSDGFGTPLLLVVGENKIIDKVDGLTDRAHYTEFFKNNGFIQ